MNSSYKKRASHCEALFWLYWSTIDSEILVIPKGDNVYIFGNQPDFSKWTSVGVVSGNKCCSIIIYPALLESISVNAKIRIISTQNRTVSVNFYLNKPGLCFT